MNCILQIAPIILPDTSIGVRYACISLPLQLLLRCIQGTGSVNKNKDVQEYIEVAIDAGFQHFDTAQVSCIAHSNTPYEI